MKSIQTENGTSKDDKTKNKKRKTNQFNSSDDDSDNSDIDRDDNSNASDSDEPINEKQKKTKKFKKSEEEEDTSYEEVPIEKLSPEQLALGEVMVNSRKAKQQLIDDSYNRLLNLFIIKV
jgi:hypothetical protein